MAAPTPRPPSTSELLRLVEEVARCLPGTPRLAILDAVESEWERLGAGIEPFITPFVAPAARWRLQHLRGDPLAA